MKRKPIILIALGAALAVSIGAAPRQDRIRDLEARIASLEFYLEQNFIQDEWQWGTLENHNHRLHRLEGFHPIR